MLAYNEIKPKKVIVYNDQPHEVLTSDIAKRTKQKPVNQTKLRNLITGATVNIAFRQSDKVEEAELEKTELKFAYQKRDELWFVNPDNPSDRYNLDHELVGNTLNYIKENEMVEAQWFDGEIIKINPPIKVHRTVKLAPPNIRGNTSAGGTKSVTLDTDHPITTPLFIETGDVIEINTETDEYVTRVSKA